MTIPARYLLRMAAFLLIVAVGLLLVGDQLTKAFRANLILNGLIIGALTIGIVFCFWLAIRLWPEVAWIRRYQRGDDVVEKQPHLLVPMATMIAARRGRPLRLTTSSMRSILDGVGARLDEGRELSRYLIGLLVFLGLLGTFWGLLETIQAVTAAIDNLTVRGGDDFSKVFDEFKKNLVASLGGAGTAFSTSLFGLGGSLVLGFLDLQAGQAQNRFYTNLEDWLSGMTRLTSLPTEVDGDEEETTAVYLQALLEHTADTMSEIQEVIAKGTGEQQEVTRSVQSLGKELRGLTDELRGGQLITQQLADNQVALRPILDRLADERTFGQQELATQLHNEFQTLTNRLTELHLEMRPALQELVRESAEGRQELVNELRNEFRILARTLATAADSAGKSSGS